MLSTIHKFLYLHIPKTGGNSIQTILAEYCDDEVVHRRSAGRIKGEDGTQGLDVFNKKLGFTEARHKHATLADYHEKLGSELDSLFVFASVRNPFDRAISSTIFARGPIIGKLKPKDFKLFKPQVEDLKINGKIAVRNFIRFENIQEDFDRICLSLKIPKATLPHKNATIREHYSTYYTDETRSFIRSLYQEDILHFGYEF